MRSSRLVRHISIRALFAKHSMEVIIGAGVMSAEHVGADNPVAKVFDFGLFGLVFLCCLTLVAVASLMAHHWSARVRRITDSLVQLATGHLVRQHEENAPAELGPADRAVVVAHRLGPDHAEDREGAVEDLGRDGLGAVVGRGMHKRVVEYIVQQKRRVGEERARDHEVAAGRDELGDLRPRGGRERRVQIAHLQLGDDVAQEVVFRAVERVGRLRIDVEQPVLPQLAALFDANPRSRARMMAAKRAV